MTKSLLRPSQLALRQLQRIPLTYRSLYLTSSCQERKRPAAITKPADDDYYSLLLSSPLPTAASPSNASTPPGPRDTSPSTLANESSKPPGPRNTSTNPPRDVRVVFGSRLAGPAEAREKQGWAEARPKEPDNCCMSGCANCVWDLYREEMEEWAARQRKAHTELIAGEADKARKMRGRGKRKEAEAQGQVRADSDYGGTGAYKGVDLAEEGLFESIPVGIREFMNTEKRLREQKQAR